MTTVLLDTNVLIAIERGTRLELADVEWVTSAMTIAEINVGVLSAPSATTRQRRLQTLLLASSRVVLPFDEPTASTYAELYAWATSAGWKPSRTDCIIAATAATNAMPLLTLDARLEPLAGFDGLEVRVVPSPT